MEVNPYKYTRIPFYVKTSQAWVFYNGLIPLVWRLNVWEVCFIR